ncbi:immunoglobulin-like domain-containing protein [Bacillus sp. 37MA]|uniref:immunoglobulin-like domain-containing protein n=1 Tax=Bacillus sp. 37MA TaxID=1132442 RepID=UPI000360971B
MFLLYQSDIAYRTGEYFSIEKFVDGTWFVVPFKDDMFNDVGIVYPSKTSSSATYSLGRLENNLTPGEYRVVKTFSSEGNNQSQIDYTLAVPFKIGK